MRGCAGAATLRPPRQQCHRLLSVQFLVPPGSSERCEARCSNSRSGGLRAHKGSIRSPLDFIPPAKRSVKRQERKGGLLQLPPSLVELRGTSSSSQRSSYSAKAEYPVRCGFSTPSLTPRNIGSPAGACHRAAIRPTRWQAMTWWGVVRSYSIFEKTKVDRHCERSEAIHQAAKKEWIASLRSQ